jgi:predicted Zn-dependent protease
MAGAQVATSGIAVPLHPAALILVPAQILVRQMVLSSYGRSHEQEADERALELLQKAGKPPGVMRYGLEFMREAHSDTGGGWFSTHPATSERIAGLPVLEREELCASPVERQAAIEAERAVAKRLKEAEEQKKQDAPKERADEGKSE